MLPICGQFIIIWHMANLLAGVSMVDSIVQRAWMNMMHSGFSTTGKSVSLNHQRFLLFSHEFRGDKESFKKGKRVRKGSPKRKLIADIVKMLGELKESQDGGFEGYGEKHNWTHKSCLWKLPYAKTLILPHNINLKHHEHNVAESIISMCFDATGFSKDNVNARKDLADLCNRLSMEPKINTKGNLKRTRAPYCLKLAERKEILWWLKKLKSPDRYASNIK
jgi:hypothetical protein